MRLIKSKPFQNSKLDIRYDDWRNFRTLTHREGNKFDYEPSRHGIILFLLKTIQAQFSEPLSNKIYEHSSALVFCRAVTGNPGPPWVRRRCMGLSKLVNYGHTGCWRFTTQTPLVWIRTNAATNSCNKTGRRVLHFNPWPKWNVMHVFQTLAKYLNTNLPNKELYVKCDDEQFMELPSGFGPVVQIYLA